MATRRLVSCLLLLTLGTCAAAHAQTPWADSYAHEAAGDYEAAMRALEPVLADGDDHELAVLRMGWLEYLNGDYNASIRDYRRALDLNADSLEARLGLTLPLLAQRRWREAAAEAERVLSVAPWSYFAHIRLLAAEEGLQQWQRLAAHASELAARYPSDATALVYLARARAWQGNVAAARAAYARVLERVPGHEEALAYLNR